MSITGPRTVFTISLETAKFKLRQHATRLLDGSNSPAHLLWLRTLTLKWQQSIPLPSRSGLEPQIRFHHPRIRGKLF